MLFSIRHLSDAGRTAILVENEISQRIDPLDRIPVSVPRALEVGEMLRYKVARILVRPQMCLPRRMVI